MNFMEVYPPLLSLGFSIVYGVLSGFFYAFANSNGLVFSAAMAYVIAMGFTSVVLFGKGDQRIRIITSFGLLSGTALFALLQLIGLIHHDRELLFWTSFVYLVCVFGTTFLMDKELKRERPTTEPPLPSHSTANGEISLSPIITFPSDTGTYK